MARAVPVQVRPSAPFFRYKKGTYEFRRSLFRWSDVGQGLRVIFVLPGNGMDNMRDSLLSIAVISNRITTLFQLFVGSGYYESVNARKS